MPIMQPPALKNLVGYTAFAAITLQEIADSASVPFLGSASTLTSSILNYVESVQSNKDGCVEMVEQIHEILCAIIKLYSISEIAGVLPTAMLYDIAKFAETLQKVHAFVKDQQGIKKIKRLFKKLDNATRLEECKQELSRAQDMFKARASGSIIAQMAQMKKDAKQQHNEIVALIAAHPDLTNSDHSSVAGTFSSIPNNSSGSFSILPPYPQIFHGREAELHNIVKILLQDSARIAILGAGGMGKTSLAAAALHDLNVAAKYSHRHFVSCHSTPTCSELMSAIADHIGVEKGTRLSRKVVVYFTHAAPSLLILDNLETPWEPLLSRPEVEEFLSLLADIPHLGILITMRGAERPAKVKWTRPFLAPLKPLSKSAAHQTFFDIADNNHEEKGVNNLLELTGNLPLAISLIASVASYEGCDTALSRWKYEGTRMLSDGCDKRSSLDISIMLSYTSSRMTLGAQELLSVLSMLPDGLTDTDLMQLKIPISHILECKATLVQTSLAFPDNDQRLKVLVPIREHVFSTHPPNVTLKLALRCHFHKLLELWNDFHTLVTPDIATQIAQNLGNLHSVFWDALNTECPDVIQNFQSILYLNHFYRVTQSSYSNLMHELTRKMVDWKEHQIFGDYMIHRLNSIEFWPLSDAETEITIGTQYFESRPPAQQANWYQSVGFYWSMEHDNTEKALECFQRVLSLMERAEHPDRGGQHSLCNIAIHMLDMGNPHSAQQYAKRAQDYAEHLGDIATQAYAVYLQGRCQATFANYKLAQILMHDARELLRSCGLQGGKIDTIIQLAQAEGLLLKTEYRESRLILLEIVSALDPAIYRAVLATVNITLIDILTGVDSQSVHQNMEACQLYVKSLHGVQQTHIGALNEFVSAELYRRDGDYSTANSIFATQFRFFRDKSWMDEALTCLERLSDLSTGMNNVEMTQQWMGIFLALALKCKDNLFVMKALRCLGQIFVAQGDDASAASVLSVAVDGFTFMDVFWWRADCMVRIADILERKGEVRKSVELWKAARPLFERSLQSKDVAQIDVKLAGLVDFSVLEEDQHDFRIGGDTHLKNLEEGTLER